MYHNDRFSSTTKIDPYRAMINESDKELMKIIKKNLKQRLKAKIISETYPDGSYVGVSNCIKIIDKVYAIFIFQENYKSPN